MAGVGGLSVSYDEFDVSTFGVAFAYNDDYLISGLSVVTRGFVYGLADIWVIEDDCAATTWTEVSDP